MNTILIIGESGSGKSTSLRNLDPKETIIINVMNKPLPFRGAVKAYGNNILSSDDAANISQQIANIVKNRPEIKQIIVDDFHYIMTNELMRKAFVKGYDKFNIIGKSIFDVVMQGVSSKRNNIKIFFLAHSVCDEHGVSRCKTVGKMIDNQISLEGICTIVLHAKAKNGRHIFQTQNDGSSIAKSPMGMFQTNEIDNDLDVVIKRIDEYYKDEEAPLQTEVKSPEKVSLSDDINKALDEATDDKLLDVCREYSTKYPDLTLALRAYYTGRMA